MSSHGLHSHGRKIVSPRTARKRIATNRPPSDRAFLRHATTSFPSAFRRRHARYRVRSAIEGVLQNPVKALPFRLETPKTSLAQCIAADHRIDGSIDEVVRKAPFDVRSEHLQKRLYITPRPRRIQASHQADIAFTHGALHGGRCSDARYGRRP